jgi:hypothetical protein
MSSDKLLGLGRFHATGIADHVKNHFSCCLYCLHACGW